MRLQITFYLIIAALVIEAICAEVRVVPYERWKEPHTHEEYSVQQVRDPAPYVITTGTAMPPGRGQGSWGTMSSTYHYQPQPVFFESNLPAHTARMPTLFPSIEPSS